MNNPIGVFDSGVGGLTVVQEINRLMPEENIIYVGDSGRAPYGGKDAETLFNYGYEIISFFIEKKVKAVVMACGTSSSNSYQRLCAEFPNLPMVDTIRPAVKATIAIAKKTPEFKPVFIATAATVKSGLFSRLFSESAVSEKLPEINLYSRACPLFAPMVEAGLSTIKKHPLLFYTAENYLADLRGKTDTVILGCTHYPLLTDALTHALGNVSFINPATSTAETLKKLLPKPSVNTAPEITYYTSGEPEKFAKIAKFILNKECNAEKIKPLVISPLHKEMP